MILRYQNEKLMVLLHLIVCKGTPYVLRSAFLKARFTIGFNEAIFSKVRQVHEVHKIRILL